MGLVDELRGRKTGGSPGLIVRHGPRERIDSERAVLEARITAEGAEASRAFGATLAGLGEVAAWHSPIIRCGETAEALVEGLAQAGSPGRVAGPLSAIGGPYLIDPVEAMREFVKHRSAFVRRWFDGEYPPSLVLSRAETTRLQLAGLVDVWQREQSAGLAVFVTHDLNLLAMREELLGIRHEDAGWIACLDGLWLALRDGSLHVGACGETAEVPVASL